MSRDPERHCLSLAHIDHGQSQPGCVPFEGDAGHDEQCAHDQSDEPHDAEPGGTHQEQQRKAGVIGRNRERRRRGDTKGEPGRDVNEPRAADDCRGAEMRDPSSQRAHAVDGVGTHDEEAGDLHDGHRRHGHEIQQQTRHRDARKRRRHHGKQRELDSPGRDDRRGEP